MQTVWTKCLVLAALAPSLLAAQSKKLEPLKYTIRIPEPSSKTFNVEIVVPTEKRDSVILMMAVWSPGMYTMQNYANQVSAFTANQAARGSRSSRPMRSSTRSSRRSSPTGSRRRPGSPIRRSRAATRSR